LVPAAISPVGKAVVRCTERFPSGCCHRCYPQTGRGGGRCCRPDPAYPQERLCQLVHRNEVWQERAKRKPEGMAMVGRGGWGQICGFQIVGGVYEIY